MRVTRFPHFLILYTFIALSLSWNALSREESGLPQDSRVVWAQNIGGEVYRGQDGIVFSSDSEAGAKSLPNVKASQDETVFNSYREGNFRLKLKLEAGEYAVTLYFVEPDPSLERREFNIILEGKTVESDFNVRSSRDGNALSALTHSIPNVLVDDGELNLELIGTVSEPVLSGVVVTEVVAPDNNWELVWSDEFDYQGKPDNSKWNTVIWPQRKVNDENQMYTDSLDNVRVENGRLILEAHKVDSKQGLYTSGRIHSAGKGDLLYGRVEFNAKLPSGQGTWPALWMMPTNPFKYATNCSTEAEWEGNDQCDAWPNSGEIDVMEHVGYQMNRVHGTVHNKAYYWVNGEQRKASINAYNVADEFHTYSMEWSPERIDVFFEGVRYFTYLNQGEGWQAWPYDHPYHLIMNLAIGGYWGRAGGPIDDSIFPVRMEVDYVRVFKRRE